MKNKKQLHKRHFGFHLVMTFNELLIESINPGMKLVQLSQNMHTDKILVDQ